MAESERVEDAHRCPILLHQVHLRDLSLLDCGPLRQFCLHLGQKRLAEYVASETRSLKRSRNASCSSLESRSTAESRESDLDAAKSLAQLSAHRASPVYRAGRWLCGESGL